MVRLFVLRQIFTLLIIVSCVICKGQTVKTYYDTLILKHFTTKWFVAGANYELLNAMPGVIVSNGFDEVTLIHFEDIPARYLYKLQAQTNFNHSYTYSASVKYNYPFIFRRLWFSGLEYLQRNIQSLDLFQREIKLSASVGTKYGGILTKIGCLQINSQVSPTIGLGFERRLFKKFSRKVEAGFMINYHFKYITYNAFMQGILFKKINTRLTYEKIRGYNFLNLGVHFLFRRWIEEKKKD